MEDSCARCAPTYTVHCRDWPTPGAVVHSMAVEETTRQFFASNSVEEKP